MNSLMNKTLKTAALLGTLTFIGAAQAGPVPGQGTWETKLQARDVDKDGTTDAFYDTELKVTWLRAGSTNAMNWGEAKAWAENSNFFGLSGWRLPTTRVTTADGSCDMSLTGGTSCGANPDSSVATGSEMAHLFFQSLGNKSFYIPGTMDEQAGWGLTNTGDFENLQSFPYWSGTEYAPASNSAWFFNTQSGVQEGTGYEKFVPLFALAVRPGDVAAAVPEPQTLALTLIALTGLAVARRRSKQQ